MHSLRSIPSSRLRLIVAMALLSTLALSPLRLAHACTICSLSGSSTYAEILASSNAVVLVNWVKGQKADSETEPGSTTYRVQQIVKGPKKLSPGQVITLGHYHHAKPAEQFVLFGKDAGDGQGLEWSVPVAMSDVAFKYLTQAPPVTAPAITRLSYYLKFLESTEPIVADDAYTEFGLAQFQDIALLADQLPQQKIRKWIASSQTPENRQGLYGVLLGLCGDDEDARQLEQRILAPTEEFRIGLDGLMVGYLLLTKDRGLDVLDQAKLKDHTIPFSETYSALQAVRFMWSYAPERIAPERLKQSLRLLIDRPELTDMIIADLARWKDWSVQGRLVKMYGNGDYNTPSIKRAIIKYLLVCSKDVPEGGKETIPMHAAESRKLLEALRLKDPKTVSDAERFFIAP